MTPYPAISGNYELQILKQVRLLKGPVKANFPHVVGFVVVDQELLLRCPVMAVDHNDGQFFRAMEWLMFF